MRGTMHKPRLRWISQEERQREWRLAREALSNDVGALKPSGTKFSRKESGLTHSFIVLNYDLFAISRPSEGKIFGRGSTGYVRWIENESGKLFALKIQPYIDYDEAYIAYDLRVAEPHAIRKRQGFIKLYIPYLYLGLSLKQFPQLLNLEQTLDLCIEITLKFHELHQGSTSRSHRGYLHRDVHFGNIVVDDMNHPHLIDFGHAILFESAYEQEENFQVMKLFHDEDTMKKSYCLLSRFFSNHEISFLEEFNPKQPGVYLWIQEETPAVIHYTCMNYEHRTIRDHIHFSDIQGQLADKIPGAIVFLELCIQLNQVRDTQQLHEAWLHIKRQYEIDIVECINEILEARGHLPKRQEHLLPLLDFFRKPYSEFRQEHAVHALIDIAFVLLMARLRVDYHETLPLFNNLRLTYKEYVIKDMQQYLKLNEHIQAWSAHQTLIFVRQVIHAALEAIRPQDFLMRYQAG